MSPIGVQLRISYLPEPLVARDDIVNELERYTEEVCNLSHRQTTQGIEVNSRIAVLEPGAKRPMGDKMSRTCGVHQ
jgi:hypothetical protein